MSRYKFIKMEKRINLKKEFLIIAFIFVIMTGLSGCGSTSPSISISDETVLATGEYLHSEKERVSAPEISNGDRKKLVEGNMEFALDLYQQLVEDEDNFMFSPYSISSALAMTYAGANGTTAEQMASTMHFELPETKLHQGFNSLDQVLVEGNGSSEDTGDENNRLHIVNAIWGQKNYEFRKSFLDTLAEHYGAGLRIVDYRNNPEAARITINDWISRETEEKITELIPQGMINKLTRLVLTNALYFKAA